MKANTLLTTNNYSMFKLTDYNRNVDLQHVQQLVNELKAGHKFLQPIVVNEKLEIIDGQHRLKAMEELKRPVEYIVRPGTGKADVISMNNTQKSWNPVAWIQSYATMLEIETIKLYFRKLISSGSYRLRLICLPKSLKIPMQHPQSSKSL